MGHSVGGATGNRSQCRQGGPGGLGAIPGPDESSFPAEDLSPGGAHCGQISAPAVSMPSQVPLLRQPSEVPIVVWRRITPKSSYV